MKLINKWVEHNTQVCILGSHEWSVARLIQLSKDLDVFEIPLEHLNVYYSYDRLTLRDMVMHMIATRDASLDYPIILDEDGELMDGRHRIMKALYLGKSTILAVRFEENPTPCKVNKK